MEQPDDYCPSYDEFESYNLCYNLNSTGLGISEDDPAGRVTRDEFFEPLVRQLFFQCSICGSVFDNINALRNHENTSHVSRRRRARQRRTDTSFTCRLCPAVFGNFITRNIHELFVHGYNEPELEEVIQEQGPVINCEVCFRAVDDLEELAEHMISEHNNSM